MVRINDEAGRKLKMIRYSVVSLGLKGRMQQEYFEEQVEFWWLCERGSWRWWW